MRKVLLAVAAAAIVTTPGSAQLLGGRLSLPSTPSLPSVPSVSTPSLPSAPSVPAIDSARQAIDEANSTVRSVTGDTPQPETVEVSAGVSTWVNRGTRCHYAPDNSYYDAIERDGYYYCEQRKAGAAAGATAPH